MARKELTALAALALVVNGLGGVEVKAQSWATTPKVVKPRLIAQGTSVTTDPNRIAAEKAEAEASELSKQDAPLTQIIAKREEALKYWRLAGDRRKEVGTLILLSAYYFSLRGEYPKAAEYAQQGLSILKDSKDLEDRQYQASLFQLLGVIYKESGEYQKALEIQTTLQKNVQLLFPDSPKILPGILIEIGHIYGNLGEGQKQRDYYNQALAFWVERKNELEQAEILDIISISYAFTGETKQAIAYFNRANQLDPQFKRGMTMMQTLYLTIGTSSCSTQLAGLKQALALEPENNKSNISESVATTEPNNTIDFLQKSIQKYREKGFLISEAFSLNALAGEYVRVGDLTQTLATYQQALKLRQFMGGKPGEAEVLANIADVLNQQGKKQEAINTLNQALEIQRRLNIRPVEADTLNTLGNIYLSLGAYDSSLDAYQKALAIHRNTGDKDGEGRTLQYIGWVYKELKNYPSALEYYQQAFVIAETNANCLYAAVSKRVIGQIYLESGDQQQAIININITSKFAEQLNTSETKLVVQAGVENLRAKVNLEQGNYAETIKLAQEARRLAQQSGVRQVEARILKHLAEAYIGLKQPDKAIQTYQEQLTLYRAISLQPEEAQTLYDLACLEQQTGKLTDALKTIDEAIEIIENIRKTVIDPELRTSFFATKQDYYALKIDILMELHQQAPSKGYDAQAFDTSERSRARTFLELLNEASTDIRQGVDPQLLEQEKAVQYKLAALERQWSESLSKNVTEQEQLALQQQQKKLLSQAQEIQTQIRAKSPKYAALKYPQPLILDQVQQQLLDPDTALLQYALGQDKSYLWVVTQDGFQSYVLPASKDLETSARNLLDTIQSNQQNLEIIAQRVNQLSQQILAPASAQLNKKRLIIVPDGALNYLPFSVLTVNNQTLLSNHELINLPSSSSLALIRQDTQNRQPAPKALAILADPIFSADDDRLNTPPQPVAPTNPDL
ncbi:MAG: tetratricopeptide repeat protein, partial [Cyanobacteriota bacterium]